MTKTSIEWTEMTWNPVRGCSRVSEGCRNCYAERMAARFSGNGFDGMTADSVEFQPFAGFATMTPSGPRWTGRVELIESQLDIPLRRRKPTTWFVNSMSDLFHESLPDEAIDRVFAVMALCPQHTFQVLTKRAERMREYCNGNAGRIADAIIKLRESRGDFGVVRPVPSLAPGARWWPLSWVWLGVSCEDQPNADKRIVGLLQTPAAVRFVSMEPLLGPIDLTQCGATGMDFCTEQLNCEVGIDWVIVGGESGPKARPMHPDWVRGIRDQCVAAGVPFFFKQWGAHIGTHIFDPAMVKVDSGRGYLTAMARVGKKTAGRLLDGREWNQMPNPSKRISTGLPVRPLSAPGGAKGTGERQGL